MMNGEIVKCLFAEWMKEKGDPRTDSHPVVGCPGSGG